MFLARRSEKISQNFYFAINICPLRNAFFGVSAAGILCVVPLTTAPVCLSDREVIDAGGELVGKRGFGASTA
jgi:hypothetical protein